MSVRGDAEERFDLVVLGAGNAGQAAASAARHAGWSVCVVEERDVGGTCPLRGCVPKKVLVAAAEAMDLIARAAAHGISVGPPKLDWAALIRRERTFVAGVSASMEEGLARQGVAVVHGSARFVDRTTVVVGDRRLRARKVIVATGSAPRALAVPGADATVTSEDVLVNETLPSRIVFIGAGVISFEFAHVFARAGAHVTILGAGPHALDRLDAKCVELIVNATRALGIGLELDAQVDAIDRQGDALAVRVRQGGTVRSIAADRVVNATGREPTTAALDLDRAGIEHQRGRIRVDAWCASVSNPDVYVAGDAHPAAPQLSALATHVGALAARNAIEGNVAPLDLRAVPSAVFTVPAVASVGLTAAAAEKLHGDAAVVVDNDMVSWRSARTYAESVAFARVIKHKATDRILGAHLIGHGAPELIHAFAAAIERDETAAVLADRVYAYPTFHSDMRYLVGR